MRSAAENLLLGLLLVVVCVVVLFHFGVLGRKAKATTLQQGSLEVQGLVRTFSLALPSNFSSRRSYPIVMALHGGMGSGQLAAEQTSLADYVDRNQFIAVFPDAGGRQWNDGRATTYSETNDVTFLLALVQHIASRYGGDPHRAFLAGGSNGGMMAQRVACEATASFRAYVAVVANLPEELSARCRPSRPVPIMFILSKDDPGMPWEGGELRGGARLGLNGRRLGAGGRVISGPDTVGLFAGVNGCSGHTVTPLPNRVNDGTSVRLHTYRCSGSPVVLYEIRGGGHGWPGSRMQRNPRQTHRSGVISQEINATEVMLDFFAKNGL